MRCFRLLCLGFFLSAVFSTEAAQLLISVGTTANDGSGDTIRQAFQKVNTNFTEVYSNIANLNVTAGESNYLGNYAATSSANANISIIGPKVGPTNQVKTFRAGANVVLTNEGTNIVIASTASGSGGGGSNYLFDAKQFASASGGTNVAIKPGAAETNIVFYPDASSLVAWAVADSSLVYITNSTGHLLNSSWLFEGTSTLGMDANAVIFDYPGSSKTWNFKATQNGNTVARISDVNGATNGVAPLSFDGTQFTVSQGTNVAGKSGIQVTNVDANGLTNRGASTLVGAVEARAGANITGAANVGNLTSTNAIVGQAGENLTGALNVGGTLTATGAVVAASTENLTGALNVGGAVTLSNSVVMNGTANIASSVNVGGILQVSNILVALSTENVISTLSVGGAIIGSNNLQVTGTSTHGGAATFTNAVEAKSTLNVAGAENVGGLLTASNGIVNQSTLTNAAPANFASAVTNWAGETTFGASTNGGPVNNGGIGTNWAATYFKSPAFTGNQATTVYAAIDTNGQVVPFGETIKSINNGFPASWAKLNTNGPLKVMFFGDSLIGGYLDVPLMRWFKEAYGLAGGYGPGGIQYAFYHTNSPGVTEYFNDALAVASSWDVTNGSHVTFQSFPGPSVLGNYLILSFIQSNGAGGFKLQTNLNNAGWVDMTGVTNANSGASPLGPTNVTLRFPLSATAPLQLRVVGQSLGASNPAVRITGAGIWNLTAPGVIYINQAVAGGDVSQYVGASTNTQWAAWREVNPDLIIYDCIDGIVNTTNVWKQHITNFVSYVNKYLTNTDILFVGTIPQETRDDEMIYQDQVVYNACLTNRWNFLYTRGFMGGISNAIKYGWMASGDIHQTNNGSAKIVDEIAKLSNLFHKDSANLGTARFITPTTDLAGRGSNRWATVWSQDGNSEFMSLTANRLNVGPISTAFWIDLGAAGTGVGVGPGMNEFTFGAPDGRITTWGDYTSWYYSATQDGSFRIQQASLGAKFWRRIGTNSYGGDHTVFMMGADGSCTNFTTTTNTWWGTGSGSRRIDPSFFNAIGDTMDGELEGNFFTGGTPGNCRIMVMLNTASATNIVAQVLVTPPVNSAGLGFKANWRHTCRSTGASGTIKTTGSITFQGANTVWFTNSLTTLDLTAQMRNDFMSTNGAATDSFTAGTGSLILR